jgi:hypothetical protein
VSLHPIAEGTTLRIRLALIVVAVMAMTAFAASPAFAATGADYGKHVSTMAKTMGFSGAMNPGMHQGFAGFAGMGGM